MEQVRGWVERYLCSCRVAPSLAPFEHSMYPLKYIRLGGSSGSQSGLGQQWAGYLDIPCAFWCAEIQSISKVQLSSRNQDAPNQLSSCNKAKYFSRCLPVARKLSTDNVGPFPLQPPRVCGLQPVSSLALPSNLSFEFPILTSEGNANRLFSATQPLILTKHEMDR